MRYRVKLEFLCDDHRLRGAVEREVDDNELWRSTTRQLLDGFTPVILGKYPYIRDSIDYIEVLKLSIETP